MIKKISVFLFCTALILGFSACGSSGFGETYDKYSSSIDTDFSEKIIEKLSSFGDDPATGNRSAGSPAEHRAAGYLAKAMKKAGLKNITTDAASVDGWTYKGADLTYRNAESRTAEITLGGYATTLKADNEKVQVVYLGQGTAEDYEGIDVKDKLVLIDINQKDDWWISYPAYQAKVKGAKAVLAMSIMPEKDKTRIGSQDICGPADAPAYAISQEDSKALRKAVKASGKGEITATFNSDSTVAGNATSYNVWGEIPGKTDEVIYMLAHYDGYYHSQYDNASGVATCLGIAKAITDSGYKPNKTIRILFDGSEEFGRTANEYDWSTGGYEEIMNIHPEWAEKAFAAVNIDGGYPVEGETKAGIDTSFELNDFVKKSVSGLNKDSQYTWKYTSPASTGTEDFMWTRMGIPSIVAGEGGGEVYYSKCYHSTDDSFDAIALDTDGFLENHKVYGKIILDLDSEYARPMDFASRFKNIKKSLPEGYTDMDALLDEAVTLSADLKDRMKDINKSKDSEEAAAFNEKTYRIYKKIQDTFLGIDYDLNVINRHEMYTSNIEALDNTVSALSKGKVRKAYDDYLWDVDWAWYPMNFDRETCDYFKKQLWDNKKGTWGDGLIDYRMCDIDGVVRSLGKKYDQKDPDVSDEISELKALRDIQQDHLEKTLAKEKKGLESIVDTMKKYSE